VNMAEDAAVSISALPMTRSPWINRAPQAAHNVKMSPRTASGAFVPRFRRSDQHTAACTSGARLRASKGGFACAAASIARLCASLYSQRLYGEGERADMKLSCRANKARRL
jgi:hypothetical protein